ncbi:hypothetical protein SprV_0802492700 [Sparganum proliferum]
MSYGEKGWFGGGPWFVRAVKRQCRSGGGVQKASSGPSWSTAIVLRLSKSNKLTAYDDYDLREDRMKIYLESIDEGSRAAAILDRLDEVCFAPRAANVMSTLIPVSERLRRVFGCSPMPWVARATLKERRQRPRD